MTTLRLLLLSALLATPGPLWSAEPEPTDAKAAFLAGFDWVKGPGKAIIGDIAEIQVPEGHMFTGPKGAQELLRAFGNPTSGDELGFLAPTSMVWSVIFEWSGIGYVKDDEKDKLDADAILKSIREQTAAGNEWRRGQGQPELNVVGWEIPPRYNAETHNLEWAIRAESEGNPVLNYNVRLLGRKGVMSATLLVDPDQLTATLPMYEALLKDYTFREGHRYAEYRAGDKVAQYGLAALILGGAAAGAAKLGLFAWLALILKKGWKLLVIAVVGAVAGVRRLIQGGRRGQPG